MGVICIFILGIDGDIPDTDFAVEDPFSNLAAKSDGAFRFH